MKEEWKEIEEFNGRYQISSFGYVKNCTGHIMSQYVSSSGYRIVKFCWQGNKNTNRLVHRLVASAFIENTFDKPQVNHIDGDRFNNHKNNLEWVTQSENLYHASSMGKMARRLTLKDIEKIKTRIFAGDDSLSIARDFSVANWTIKRIAKGESHNNKKRAKKRDIQPTSGTTNKKSEKILMLISSGESNANIAKSIGVSCLVVKLVREHYNKRGTAA